MFTQFAYSSAVSRSIRELPVQRDLVSSSSICSYFKPTQNIRLRYRLLKNIYMSRSLSAIRQQFLSRIVTDEPFGTRFLHAILYRLLNKIANNLLMNEFEISLWALFIDQLSETEKSFKPALLLYFTAVAAKGYFNKDISIYEQHSHLCMPNFNIRYSSWLCMTNCNFDVTYSQIHNKYNQLSSPDDLSIDRLIQYLQLYPKLEESESKSEISTVDDLENKLEMFQHDILGGEKLEDIDNNLEFS